MPPTGIWNVDWLNGNTQRAFPLDDAATRIDSSGTFTLPNDFIADITFAHSQTSFDPSLFHIMQVGSFGAGYTVSIGYDGTLVGSAAVASSGYQDYTPVSFTGVGTYDNAQGVITFGKLTTIAQTPGTYDFSVVGGRLTPCVIRPDIRGVTSLAVTNGNETSSKSRGDIELVAGERIRLTVSTSVITGNKQIRIDAIDGENLNAECDCDGAAELPDPIRTINGIAPDVNGNFTLYGTGCLEITDLGNGLQLNDTCAKPCCTCADHEVVLEALRTLSSKQSQVGALLTAFDKQLAAMEAIVNGSRLSRQECQEP